MISSSKRRYKVAGTTPNERACTVEKIRWLKRRRLRAKQRSRAKQKIAEAGLGAQIGTVSGDFFSEELPKGSDTILLSMILHDWGPDKNRVILRKCFDALPSGGAIIINELMMNDDKCGPLPAALMSMVMIISTEGRNYTWAEYEEWLKEAGFVRFKRIPLDSPGANGILVGYKP
jgi:3-hydroxy-5-methyl-1-naphthoate 3-O-methyltransferase